MLLLFVLVAAAVVAFVVWRTLGADQATADRPDGQAETPDRPRPAVPRASGPDDDPDFLRSLDERVKRRDDEPPAGSAGT